MIAKAVKTALYGGLAATLAVSAPASFAAEDGEEAEKITVTGTRIKRVDVETHQPVTILTRADIDMSGDTSVADALRSQSTNSFGSWKGKSGYGSGATGSAEIDLRGVGATLVLVDGRRMPGAGYDGGATQDLNNIPLSVVERIEILRGGASAIYGSDAVAGVVNIITRKDVEGGSISLLTESPEVSGGDKTKIEFAAGVSGDRGSMIIVGEHQDTRFVADNALSGFDNGVSWWSAVPNAEYYHGGLGGWVVEYNEDLCESVPNTVDQGYRCGYAYSNVTWHYPSQIQDSIMAKFNYDLTDDITMNARLSYVGTKTDSRYAPTPVSTNNLTMDPTNANNPFVDAISPVYIYLRTALLGNRDARFNKDSVDFLFGLEGSLDSGYDWTANYQRTNLNETLYNYNLINDNTIQAAINDESFDVFNVSGMTSEEWAAHALGVFQSAAHTGLYQVEQVKDIVDATIGGEVFSNDTVSVAFVLGGEFERTDFTQISDPESGQGFISGGSGGDDVFATRDRSAVFTELNANFDFGLELSAAFRYDKYDQTGDIGIGTANREFSDTTPQYGISYRPTDDILIRATFGEAFRAPTMPELFASNSFGFPSAYDYYYCDTLGNPAGDAAYCNVSDNPQHLTFFGGNPTLSSEQADTMNFGFVWNITDDLVVQADYYDIEYYDKIASISLNDLMLLDQQAGGTSAAVTRGANGQIESIQSGSINIDQQETSGIDLGVAYNMETSLGDFQFKGDVTRVLDWGFIEDGTFVDYVGNYGFPEWKANLTTSWSNGDWFGAWRMNYIGSQEAAGSNPAFNTMDATLYHNVQVGLNTSWDAQIVVGARNVFDKSFQWRSGNGGWRNYNSDLYSVMGRTVFVKYEQSF